MFIIEGLYEVPYRANGSRKQEQWRNDVVKGYKARMIFKILFHKAAVES
jgi:hypothetical protein